MFLHVHGKDSDQSGRMPMLIWVFTGRTGYFRSSLGTQVILLGLSICGSFNPITCI